MIASRDRIERTRFRDGLGMIGLKVLFQKKWLIASRCTLMLMSIVLATFLVEFSLMFLGFPGNVPEVVSHPPGLNQHRRQVEFQYQFKTNSEGLRYQELPLTPAQNERRIFVAGDSFTEGEGVEDSERFSNLLERSFQGPKTTVRFINGGLTGAGPLEYGNLFVKVGRQYKPDALLVCFFVNDVPNTAERLYRVPFMIDPPRGRSRARRLLHRIWPRINTQIEIVEESQTRKATTVTSDFVTLVTDTARSRGISDSVIEKWKTSVPVELVDAVDHGRFNGSILSQGLLYPEYWTDAIDVASPSAHQRWQTVEQILSSLMEHCRLSDTDLAVVLLPSPFQCDPSSHSVGNPWVATGSRIRREWLTEETGVQKRLSAWAIQRSIPFLDLTPEFRERAGTGEVLYWPLDGHWNASGHRVAATAIENWLRRGGVFSFCDSAATPATHENQ